MVNKSVAGLFAVFADVMNGKYGLDFNCAYALMVIATTPEMSNQAKLKAGLPISKKVVTRLVFKLADKGWITVDLGHADRRQRYIRITPEGKKVLDTFLARVTRDISEFASLR